MNNLEDIRKLLDKYYEGGLEPAEVERLTHFFRETEELPADLVADKALFEAFADAEAGIEPPADLRGKIGTAIDSVQPHRRIMHVWIKSMAAAAAVAIVVGTAIKVFHTAPETTSFDTLAVTAPAPITSAGNIEMPMTENPDNAISGEQTKVMPDKSVSNPKPKARKVRAVTAAEINEAHEAISYANATFDKINRRLAKATELREKAEAKTARINETLKEIIQ